TGSAAATPPPPIAVPATDAAAATAVTTRLIAMSSSHLSAHVVADPERDDRIAVTLFTQSAVSVPGLIERTLLDVRIRERVRGGTPSRPGDPGHHRNTSTPGRRAIRYTLRSEKSRPCTSAPEPAP